MAIRYLTDLRSARMQAVADFIDRGSGPGYMEICTASYASVLATVPLAKPCGVVVGDTLTFDMPQSDTDADNTGDAAVARIKDSDGVTIIDQMTVGHTGGSEHLILDQGSNGIVSGQSFEIEAGSITHNPGV